MKGVRLISIDYWKDIGLFEIFILRKVKLSCYRNKTCMILFFIQSSLISKIVLSNQDEKLYY
jgi:hypothetical protein